MSTPDDVITVLEHLAPLRLAAEWDNVGFLVGTKRPTIQRVMTCLTLTMEIAREAVSQKADLIVTHHPLPFRPVNRITKATATGGILLELLTAGIGVWSGHTAWDSAAQGINAMLADMLSLQNIAPLEPDEADPHVGFGRVGTVSSQKNSRHDCAAARICLRLPWVSRCRSDEPSGESNWHCLWKRW